MLVGMLSGWEVAIIVLVVLLVLGPQKLPALGTSVGKMLRGFKKELNDLDGDRKAALDDKETAAEGPEIDVTPQPAAKADS